MKARFAYSVTWSYGCQRASASMPQASSSLVSTRYCGTPDPSSPVTSEIDCLSLYR